MHLGQDTGPQPAAVGVVVPLASIENSPAQATMVWPPVPVAVLDIPQAARQKSGLAHFTMYWEADGHQSSFDLVIPQVPALAGAHPTNFHAEADGAKQQYRMILSGFATGTRAAKRLRIELPAARERPLFDNANGR